MEEKLCSQSCTGCKIGTPALIKDSVDEFMTQIDDSWTLIEDGKKIERKFKFKDFVQALDFVNKVGNIAEKQGHHPDIFLAWGKALITLWTHKANGLTKDDFIMAAKIDEL